MELEERKVDDRCEADAEGREQVAWIGASPSLWMPGGHRTSPRSTSTAKGPTDLAPSPPRSEHTTTLFLSLVDANPLLVEARPNLGQAHPNIGRNGPRIGRTHPNGNPHEFIEAAPDSTEAAPNTDSDSVEPTPGFSPAPALGRVRLAEIGANLVESGRRDRPTASGSTRVGRSRPIGSRQHQLPQKQSKVDQNPPTPDRKTLAVSRNLYALLFPHEAPNCTTPQHYPAVVESPQLTCPSALRKHGNSTIAKRGGQKRPEVASL